jgi:hypothetical protein
MAQDDVLKGLLIARQSLWNEYGSLLAQAQVVFNDVQNIEAMLGRHGYQFPTGPVADQMELAPAQELESPPQEQPQPPAESVDEIVQRMINQNGAPDTAIRVVEWLLQTRQVPNPSQVRQLFERFPDVLKRQYNPDAAIAAEALRGQIRTRISNGNTQLYYDSGDVGMREEASQAQPA